MDIAYYFQQELNKKEQETFTKTEILELLTKAEEKRIEPLCWLLYFGNQHNFDWTIGSWSKSSSLAFIFARTQNIHIERL